MKKPELKQASELTPRDFERHPVWLNCHVADYEEPWYEETDEETFRPWTGALPASPDEGILLVRATIELRDGTRYPGFVTPAFDAGDLGTQQPQIFVDDQRFEFWGGIVGVPTERRQALYDALRRQATEVFPLKFVADPGLTTGIAAGQVPGFCQSKPDGFQVEQ